MVDDDVLRRDGREAVAAEIQDAFGKARRVGREQQVRPVIHDHLREVGDAEQPVHLEDRAEIRVQLIRHQLQHVGGHARIHRKPDRAAAAAALQRGFIGPHEVFGLLLEFHIGVADQAEQAGLDGHEAWEQAVQEQPDQVFQHHEADRRIPSRGPVARGQADEALDLRRQRQQGAHRAPILLPHQLQHHAESEVRDEGKGMRRIDRERREHGEDAVHEPALEPGAIGRRQRVRLAQHEACLFQQAAYLVPGLLLAHDQLPRLGMDRRQRARGRETVGRQGGDAGPFLADQTRDADRIEFVEVGGRDRDEAKTFQQRMARIGRFLQHAGVEGEPG